MAVTLMIGFEGQAVGVDNLALTGTAAYSTAQARTGAASIRCNPASGVTGYFTPSTQDGGYHHFGLYIASLPSVERVILGDASGIVNVRLTPSGTLDYYDWTTFKGSSSALSTGQWYWVGVRIAASAGDVLLQLNGVDQFTGSNAHITAPAYGCTGTEASAIDIYFDDVIRDDAGFLAPSKVALLRPISDSFRDPEWTAGAGGTTNLWDAVDNTPPAGLATETNTSQIEHAGGAIGNYHANMTTYTTAGVGAADTVLGVQGLVVWGEDSATGTKLMSYSGVSNPAWTGEDSIDVSTGDGSGATLDYLSVSPDRWNERRSAITSSPSVTLGTSPVMRVRRPETASRVASVCFMGMVVAWTPAAVTARVPYIHPYRQHLAH